MGPDIKPDVAAALQPLPPGYHTLFERLLAVVDDDSRIRALWLGGSVGRGSADVGSDLDVLLAVADDDYAAFWADWRRWLSQVTPTIIARHIPGLPGCFYSVTADCERFDLVTERVSDLGASPYRHRLAVLDRDDLDGRVPLPSIAVDGPDLAAMAEIVVEFFRQQTIFPAAVVARRDWLLGVVGVNNTQQLLYRLFVETNQPLPPMGVKQWSARLTPEQRRLMAALPAPSPNRESTIQAMRSVRAAMLTIGRESAEACGLTWPVDLDVAVARYYAKELGESRSAASSTAASASSTAASASSTSATTRTATADE